MMLHPPASQAKPYVMVVGVDFGQVADRAFAVGHGMCRLHSRAELHVLSVVNEAPDAPLSAEPNVAASSLSLEQSGLRLAAHVDALLDALGAESTPNVHVVSHVLSEVPALAITGLARELEADIIVVGTHGRRGLARGLLGSVAEGILRHASCPVFVIPPTNEGGPTPVSAESRARDGWRQTHHPKRGA